MVNILDTDEVCLESVESFIRHSGAPIPRTPEEKLHVTQYYRDQLYSNIADRLPRIAAYLLEVGDEEEKAKALRMSIEHHCMDASFVDIVMQRLATCGFLEDAHLVGALFVTVINKYFEDHKPTPKMKAEEVEALDQNNVKETAHLKNAISVLLKDIIVRVKECCPGLNDEVEIPAVAGALAVNNESTLVELMNFNKQLTADIFKVYEDPDRIIKAALKMKKNDYLKLNATQDKFVQSLKDFIFKKLDSLDMSICYRYLLSVYGDIHPKTSEYLICITDVSKAQYPNLHNVAGQFK